MIARRSPLIRSLSRLFLVGLSLACPSAIRAQQTEAPALSSPETPGLRATQVTLAIEKDRKRRQFRATIMARKDDTLTVLTAAHCISNGDENGPVLLLIEGEVMEGTVLSVVRNPGYRTNQTREIPGPDNAIARLRFKLANKAAIESFETLKPAPALSARSYPGPSGQTVSVRMIDGHGVEHAVKAGNYSNPRWLEWGPAYKPIPGDSGGGVFVMHAGADGQPRPILIGIIVGRDDRGGGASLVSREMRWIADELPR
jgi:Trypsin